MTSTAAKTISPPRPRPRWSAPTAISPSTRPPGLDQSKADHLTDGQHVTDTLTVASFDGTASQPIVVNITGSNDFATTYTEQGRPPDRVRRHNRPPPAPTTSPASRPRPPRTPR
ncbi:VCBS domain-containing protein [Bradyrhizobium sp. USDA 4519]